MRSKLMSVAQMAALALLAAIVALPAASASAAEYGFQDFELRISDTQAGGHPDLTIDAEWEVADFGKEGEIALRRFISHAPTGFIGNPHVAPKCAMADYTIQNCPVDAQVGIVNLPTFGINGNFFPLYNMETRPTQAGLLAFTTPLTTTPVFIELSARTDSDYGLTAATTPQMRFPISDFETILWGVPADPVHDIHRFQSPLTAFASCTKFETGCKDEPSQAETWAEAAVPQRPFLQNPTECGVPLVARGEIEYYGNVYATAEAPFPPTTGCSQLSFDPAIAASPTTTQTDTPSGLDINLNVPQTQSPTTPAPSELRTAEVTLPEGFTINPGAADGKVACRDAETAIGTLFAARCPEHSKIATLSLNVTALPGPIHGAMYLGEPKPGDPYPIILAADGFATNVKLRGSARPDPVTGRVTFVLEDLPQSPLAEFDMHVFGSERGLLSTPAKCGTYPVETRFVPWNGALTTRETVSYMTFDSGPGGKPCPSGARPFEPHQRAGVANNTGGSHAPFSFYLAREDGDQSLTGIEIATPPGFAATLRGVPYCPEDAIARLAGPGHSGAAEAASPACPAASQIGVATIGAGSGTHPLHVPGKVFLAGPYKGAPLSLIFSVPAVSGPYDLGNVAVRAAVRVDPVSARITVASDPLPQIREGIPLRVRSVLINLDRPNFTLNPTNCRPFAIDTTIRGDEGAAPSRALHFQVGNCADLEFKPKLKMALRGSARRLGHPALRAELTMPAGGANLRRTVVSMPKNLLLDQAHIGTPCTRAQFAAESCPASSVYGNAVVETPLLDQPLRGPVYLRTSGNKLPDLVAHLKGQLELEVSARIDTARKGGLRATFAGIPDAPVSRFVLNMKGGRKGLLINDSNLCVRRPRAAVRMVGQNGMVDRTNNRLNLRCGSKASRADRKRVSKRKARR